MKTQCPNCKAKFNVNEKNTGKKTKCPNCAGPFTIEPFVMAPLMTQASPPVKTAAPPVTPVESAAKTMEPPVATVTKIAEPIKAAETPVKEKPEPKKLSKTVYVYCWSGAQIIAGILGTLGLMLALRKGANSTLIAAFAAADVFLIGSILIELALYHKMWSRHPGWRSFHRSGCGGRIAACSGFQYLLGIVYVHRLRGRLQFIRSAALGNS